VIVANQYVLHQLIYAENRAEPVRVSGDLKKGFCTSGFRPEKALIGFSARKKRGFMPGWRSLSCRVNLSISSKSEHQSVLR
jgi:hypothetical protein